MRRLHVLLTLDSPSKDRLEKPFIKWGRRTKKFEKPFHRLHAPYWSCSTNGDVMLKKVVRPRSNARTVGT